MNNIDVAKAWIRGEDAAGSNFYSTAGKLFSYSTVIGQIEDGVILINNSSYSSSTGRHQFYMRSAVWQAGRQAQMRHLPAAYVPRGTTDLLKPSPHTWEIMQVNVQIIVAQNDEKIRKARSDKKRLDYLVNSRTLIADMVDYARDYGLPYTPPQILAVKDTLTM